jgi:quinol monooxygenase YgiN
MSVGILVEHRVKPGARDEVRAIWAAVLQPSILANTAHESYACMFDADDPDVIRAFQQYVDMDAATAFRQTTAYAHYVTSVEPFLLGPPKVTRTHIMWTKPAVT